MEFRKKYPISAGKIGVLQTAVFPCGDLDGSVIFPPKGLEGFLGLGGTDGNVLI